MPNMDTPIIHSSNTFVQRRLRRDVGIMGFIVGLLLFIGAFFAIESKIALYAPYISNDETVEISPAPFEAHPRWFLAVMVFLLPGNIGTPLFLILCVQILVRNFLLQKILESVGLATLVIGVILTALEYYAYAYMDERDFRLVINLFYTLSQTSVFLILLEAVLVTATAAWEQTLPRGIGLSLAGAFAFCVGFEVLSANTDGSSWAATVWYILSTSAMMLLSAYLWISGLAGSSIAMPSQKPG